MTISLATILAVIGVSLGILEIAVLGFGTVFLLFIAIGCLLSAFLMFAGLIEQTFLMAALSVAIISSISAMLLWKPLKRLQSNQQNPEQQPNVFSGLKFNLEQELAPGNTFIHRYSGVEWKVSKMAEDNETWPKGCEVEVVKTGVGKMWVQRV